MSLEHIADPYYHSDNMPHYKATHVPYGIADPTKRTIRNPGIKDEAEFKQYGIETGGEYFHVRTLVNGGGGRYCPATPGARRW